MFQISGNDISLTRGDSAYVEVTIDNLDQIDITECAITAQVRKKPSGGHMLFEGDIGYDEQVGGVCWNIHPEDTRGLQPGDYYYDIQVASADGKNVFTVIPVSTFTVLDEVTQREVAF